MKTAKLVAELIVVPERTAPTGAAAAAAGEDGTLYEEDDVEAAAEQQQQQEQDESEDGEEEDPADAHAAAAAIAAAAARDCELRGLTPRQALVEQLNGPAGFTCNPGLMRLLRLGVAYHNSSLTYEERALVENAYCRGEAITARALAAACGAVALCRCAPSTVAVCVAG